MLRCEVLKCTEHEKPMIRNLMQYYQYDTSDFTMKDPNPFGQFDYKYLDHYWMPHGIQQEGRRAYLVKVDGQLAGFALVTNFSLRQSVDVEVRSIAEYFIMRKWRRQGVGKQVAHELFRSFDGEWEIKQEKENLVAQRFWEAVVREYTGNDYIRLDSHEPGWDGPVIRFRKQKQHV